MLGVLADAFGALGDVATYFFKKDKGHKGRSYIFRVAVIGLVFFAYFLPDMSGALLSSFFAWARALTPLWAPLLLLWLCGSFWLRYIRADFLQKTGGTLLEIKLPREILRSPKAMELFFSSSFWQKGSVTYVDTFWDGKVGPWYSLEIASFGGDVRFYIWTFPKVRKILEAQLYAQYPTIEISEAQDYAARYPYGPEGRFMWGAIFKLEKADAYPIKTYIDYGLDKEEEEEIKVDPMTSFLEYMGSLKPGEQCWVQMLIRAHQERKWVNGYWRTRPNWKKGAEELVNKIMQRDPETKSTRKETATGFPIVPTLTEMEKDQVKAIERSLNKPPYDCVIRALYFAEGPAQAEIGKSIPGLVSAFKQYSADYFNGIRIAWFSDLKDETKDVLWFGMLRDQVSAYYMKKYGLQLYDAYRRRSAFYYPYQNFHMPKPFILTAEELATIYHFPGRVAATPTIGRAPSRKAEPPPNLPV